MLSVPEKYYVPARIRHSYEARLKAAGLWSVPKDEKSKGKQEKSEKFKDTFMREKVRQPHFDVHGLHSAIRSGFRENSLNVHDFIQSVGFRLVLPFNRVSSSHGK